MTPGTFWKRWVIQCIVAFAVQGFLPFLPRWAWFLSVFLSVAAVGIVMRMLNRGPNQIYLEDIAWIIAVYLAIALLSFGFDNVLWAYTHKHAGPALPASVLSIIDLEWKSESISFRR